MQGKIKFTEIHAIHVKPHLDDFVLEINIVKNNKATIKIPYLNSYREHGQILKISIIVDGDVQHLKVEGGGEDWSVRHTPVLNKQIRARFNTFLILNGVLGLISGIYIFLLKKQFNIEPFEINMRTLLLYSPFLLLFVLLYCWAIRLSLHLRDW
jgi:hypothetical protein